MMSFGVRFVSKLISLGYPGAENFSGKESDWIYEKNEVIPFLDWFCHSVNVNNVVQSKELADYEVLKLSGETLLDGDHLEETLANSPIRASKDTLREEIHALKDDLEVADKQLKIKQNRRLRFSEHLTTLNHQNEKLSLVFNKFSEVHEKSLSECLFSGVQLNNLLTDLNLSIDHLNETYEGFFREENEMPIHLSQLDINCFHIQEERYNARLKTYITKQFFQGVEKVSEIPDDYCYHLQVKKPNLSLIKGTNQEELLNHCQALNQLSKVYPKSKSEQIDVQSEECRLEACVRKVRDFLDMVDMGQFPTDPNTILRMDKEMQTQYALINKQVQRTRTVEINRLVKECANSLTLKIVTGDYTLKIIRQKYVMSKLEKVLEYLIRQRARCEILSLFYELELENHRELQELLEAVCVMANDDHANLKHTLDTLPQLSRMQANFEIDSYDSMCKVLHNLLVEQQRAPTPRYYILLEKTKELQSTLNESRVSLSECLKYQDDRQEILESLQLNLENTAFADSHSSNLSTLSPVSRFPVHITGLSKVEHLLSKLREQLGELETKVFSNISEHNAKLKLIKKNKMMQMERKLFYLFYTDPEKTRRELNKFTNQQTLKMKR